MDVDGDDLNADTMSLEHPEKSWFKQMFSFPTVTQLQALVQCLTNCENEHCSFARVLDHHTVRFYRFNPVITEKVGLHDYTPSKLPTCFYNPSRIAEASNVLLGCELHVIR